MSPGGITDAQFRQLCEFLYRETGLTYGEAKRYYLERRLLECMAASPAENFGAFFLLLRHHASGELENFINAVTINETYFNREEYQLECLTRHLLAHRLAAPRAAPGIRIWSLPCATGEEPYSIAIWLLENWPEVDAHEIEIIGSDIDTAVLEAARGGIYGKRALMRLDAALVGRYFEPLGDESWRIIEALRGSVQFHPANAVLPADTRRFGRFDVIFCRNMLIYFDDASRRLAAENLYEALLPGGYLCLGHAESMSRISGLFEICRYDDTIVYRRPPEAT
jgi:chemotaxis protein methyltransferase CheR